MVAFDVVLSGSGVNYAAHIGALFALAEVGEIKSVTAVSGGALVGAHYALFRDLPKLKELGLSLDLSQLVKPRFALFSVFSGALYNSKRLDLFLRSIFEDATLDDLQIDLTIVAADIKRNKPVIFSTVPGASDYFPSNLIYDAVRASMAAPIIFQPHLGLYDGGLVNNIPVDLAVDLGIHRKDRVLVGVKVRPKPKAQTERSTLKLVDVLKKTINTLLASLDREHVEENVDKIVFIDCPNSAFDFDLPHIYRLFHYHAGYYKTLNHLLKRDLLPKEKRFLLNQAEKTYNHYKYLVSLRDRARQPVIPEEDPFH